MQKCKDNANKDQFIPLEIKHNIQRMEMGKGLYSQVVMLRRKDIIFTDENKNKMKLNSIS